MRSKLTQIAKICAIVAAGSTLGMVDAAYAGPNDMDVRAQVDALQAQINALNSRLEAVQVQQAQQAATPAPAPAATAAPSNDQRVYLERKKDDDGVTFLTRGGEVTFYGNLDVSFDSTTKGIGNMTAGPNTQNPGAQPVGNNGWMPAISTNLSYVGLRGHQDLGDYPATFVWQLETQVDISATSGTTNTNSNTSDAVKGGLTSRNSFTDLGRDQDRQDRRALQDVHRHDERLLGHARRLLGHHGQHRGRQPRRVWHAPGPLDLVGIAQLGWLGHGRAGIAGPEPCDRQQQPGFG